MISLRRAFLVFCCYAYTCSALQASSTSLERRQGLLIPTTTESESSSNVVSLTLTSAVPSPTNSGVCTLHDDHWHCDGEEEDHDHDEEAEASYSSARGPEPTGRGECTAHLDHWDCDLSEAGAETVTTNTGGEGCIQHGTHFHCPAGVEASCDVVLGDYNWPIHIAAVFILLIASGLGVFSPVIFAGFSQRTWVSNTIFVLKHFGTGVIIATAFIHLLMHAFVMFANECLGELSYEATAPAIAMASAFAVFLVDFYAARWMHKNKPGTGSLDTSSDRASNTADGIPEKTSGDQWRHHGHSHAASDIVLYDGASRRAHWDVTLLEAGVVFHSIMIGVTLGAQSGSGFLPTFAAIVFHQLFEGLGLGSRIATLLYPNGGAWKKFLMCTIFALITPIGIAIGMGVHQSFNLNGKASILAVGVLDSISAGILLYTGLAQLLLADWINGEMRAAKTGQLFTGLFFLFAGMLGMAIIGKWA